MSTESPRLVGAAQTERGGHVKFWSEEFFSYASESLNKDPVFAPVFKGMRTRIIAESTDTKASFMIQIRDGVISARPAAQGEPTDFRFSAPYAEWVAIVRDDVQLRGEVVKGKVRFGGSMPMMLLMLGKVSKAEKEIVAHMQAMNPEY